MAFLPDEVRLRVGPAQVSGVPVSDAVARLRKLRPLLGALGRFVAQESRRAFEDQRWDGVAWPARYPGQAAPKLNVMGFLTDLAKGRRPKQHRFVDQPALVDTKTLRRSVASQVVSDSIVEIGAGADYADKVQRGGETILPITARMRAGVKTFLRSKRAKRAKTPGDTSGYGKHLGWLLTARKGVKTGPTSKTLARMRRKLKKAGGDPSTIQPTEIAESGYKFSEYRVRNIPRTFLAATPKIEAALAQLVQEYLQTGKLPDAGP